MVKRSEQLKPTDHQHQLLVHFTAANLAAVVRVAAVDLRWWKLARIKIQDRKNYE